MIKDYDEFVSEFIKLQRGHFKGDGVAITLKRKQRVLRRYGYKASDYLWSVPLEVLNEILKECKRSKK